MKESSKKLPDTNVILRYLLRDNVHLFERADKLFEKVRTGEEKVIVLESVLVECVYVLTKFYKVPRDETAERLKGLLQYRGILNKDKKELIDALTIFASRSIDIVDCILYTKAKSYNMVLFTFDKVIEKMP